jgi:hypothetical protein
MKTLKSISKSLLLASSIPFAACTERMDINVDDAPAQLAIYGSITTDTAQHSVTVRQTSNYFSNSQPVGINGATVTISDGESTFTLSEGQKGEYLTDAGVFGVEGKTYTLKVSIAAGEFSGEYEASSCLPHSVRVDSVKLQPSVMADYIVDALLYGMLPESEDSYMNIRTYKNDGIPLNANLSNFNIIKSESVDRKEINGAVCMNFYAGTALTSGEVSGENVASIEHGDLVTVQVCSITKEYADYVLNAQKELQGSMPIFSGPPANVQTNISTLSGNAAVCGFFTAYSQQSRKVQY